VRNRFREKFAERDVYDEEAAPARLAGAARNFGASPAAFPHLECAIRRRHGYYRRLRERGKFHRSRRQ